MPAQILLFSGLLITTICTTAGAASGQNGTYTDPAKADADFAFQGEYVGVLHGAKNNKHEKFGLQVVALGDGKFQLVAYEGGLPGAGWTGKQGDRSEAAGVLKDGIVTFKDKHGIGTLKDGVIKAKNTDGKPVGEFKKVERHSPTLGAKPPAGAIVLFDGTTADHFKGGRMTEDGLLMQGATSKQNFGSFQLHLEFLVPYKPAARGQGRGNSGAYMQSRYEVQILDSFGLAGKDNECGGIYSIKAPTVNMCLPPLVWQTYDIDFTAARYDARGKKTNDAQITVRHNGVVVHKDVKLPNSTTAAPAREGQAPGPLYLQDHGNPVRYRNIWIVETK